MKAPASRVRQTFSSHAGSASVSFVTAIVVGLFSLGPSPAEADVRPPLYVSATIVQVAGETPANGGNRVTGISCDLGFCGAVGTYEIANPPAGVGATGVFVATNAGGPWSATPEPEVGQATMGSVSCSVMYQCVAVGSNSGGAFALTLSNDSWSLASIPSPGAGPVQLTGISCAADCVAVGEFGPPNSAQPIASTLHGGTWSTVVLPLPDNGSGATGVLSGVSCSSGGPCTAVGTMRGATRSVYPDSGLAETLSNGSWQASAVILPGGPPVSLAGISCATTSSCTAVGAASGPNAALNSGVVGLLNSGIWDVTSVPNVTSLSAVSCPMANSCTMAGTAAPGSSSPAQAVIGTFDDGMWQHASTVPAVRGNPSEPPTVVSLDSISCWDPDRCVAGGQQDTAGFSDAIVARAFVPLQGYTEVASDGGIFTFGDANFYGSMGGQQLNRPVVGIAATPDGKGYWEVASDGGIFTFGDANFYGSMGGQQLNQPVVGIAATPDGKGYWEVASDGGIFTFGDASFDGSMGAQPLNQPVVAIAASPSGRGYWEVASDGGIFAFGDASFYGSMGGQALRQPVVGVAASPDGGGYWEVASDGGIFTFGTADFYGSAGSLTLDKPIVSMAGTQDGRGYRLIASDGGVFSYGDADFYGSMGGIPLARPVVGVAAQG